MRCSYGIAAEANVYPVTIMAVVANETLALIHTKDDTKDSTVATVIVTSAADVATVYVTAVDNSYIHEQFSTTITHLWLDDSGTAQAFVMSVTSEVTVWITDNNSTSGSTGGTPTSVFEPMPTPAPTSGSSQLPVVVFDPYVMAISKGGEPLR
eukprot:scaffold161490_cov33-Prasinocladus_malaysianus.AAC.8